MVEYIQDFINMLAQFSWIYEERNTDILLNDVLEKIPEEWITALSILPWKELKQIPFGLIKDDWPSSLKFFIRQCNSMGKFRFSIPALQAVENSDNETKYINKNIPLKKQIEINAMSHLIYEVCQNVQSCTVLDVGSGMGYLDEVLHHRFGLQCIGLDSEPKYTTGGRHRLKEDSCIKLILHETVMVENSEACCEKLKILLQTAKYLDFTCDCRLMQHSSRNIYKSNMMPAVMAGLHCCGELMQDMMKLFITIENLKAFVCVGCCYNKVKIEGFPMSQTAKVAIEEIRNTYSTWYPCISGLRIGTHATKSEWEILSPELLLFREKSLIYRAILQCYLVKEHVKWLKPKRRFKPSDLKEFEVYCENMLKSHVEGMSMKQKDEEFKKLNHLYAEKKHLFPRVRILLVLQLLLQPVWESFVMMDRILYFKENSVFTEIFTVWCDAVSPRNIALCGYKR